MTSVRREDRRAEAHKVGDGAPISRALQDFVGYQGDGFGMVKLEAARAALAGEFGGGEDRQPLQFRRGQQHDALLNWRTICACARAWRAATMSSQIAALESRFGERPVERRLREPLNLTASASAKRTLSLDARQDRAETHGCVGTRAGGRCIGRSGDGLELAEAQAAPDKPLRDGQMTEGALRRRSRPQSRPRPACRAVDAR